MDSVTGHFQYLNTHEEMEFHEQHVTFGFTSSSEDAHSCYQNTGAFHGAYGEQLTNTVSLSGHTLSPDMFPLGSYYGSSSHKSSMSPHIIETLLSCSTGDSRDFCDSFQKPSFTGRSTLFHFVQHHNAAIEQNQLQLSPNTKSPSISVCPVNSGATILKSNNCLSNCNNLSMVEQRLSSDSPSSSKFFSHDDSMFKARSSQRIKACICASDLCDQQPEHFIDDSTVQNNEGLLGVMSLSSTLVEGDNSGCSMITRSSQRQVENSISAAVNSLVLESDGKGSTSILPMHVLSDNVLLDGMEFDSRSNNFMHELWGNITMPIGNNSSNCTSVRTSDCISVMEGSPDGCDKGLFSESGLQHLLDSIVADHVNKGPGHGTCSKYDNSTAAPNLENQLSSIVGEPSAYKISVPSAGPSMNAASGMPMPYCNTDAVHGSPKQAPSNSNFCSWLDDSCSMNTENSAVNQSKKSDDTAKAVKKRARPGESTRPRPKDRQQIQDRLKELREIVPNGGKCSIDALLDKTIKHMLFLQSVTKYADKLKQADEPKIIGEENGVVLKDNSGSVTGGGATWAYEVAGQTMVCPIIVEDLTPPGQMLVEMLCEDRGLFLEIADIIRGFGLIILKGVMEIREGKIWARFLVEANREVTRMDIFLSLIQLLQQNSCMRSSDLATKVIDKGTSTFPGYHQSPIVSSS